MNKKQTFYPAIVKVILFAKADGIEASGAETDPPVIEPTATDTGGNED